MKYSFLLLIVVSSLSVFSQKKFKRHEIGIGLGYMNVYDLKNEKPFAEYYFSKKQIGENVGIRRNNVKGYTTPIFYYSYRPFKEVTIFTSLRWGNIKSIESFSGYNYLSDIYALNNYRLTFLESITGISVHFLNRKYWSVYAGMSFHTIKSNFYSIGNYSHQVANPYASNNLSFHLGLKINLSDRWNIRYEPSIIGSDEIFIRPISRLSLNYQF